MNFNEVIANRAQQHLGHAPGSYDVIHPNDHVNPSQSTNDVYPAAFKIATYAMLGPLITEVGKLAAQLDSKAAEFAEILHLGRTCLQDAQPMRLGQLFGGYASLTHRLADELTGVRGKLRTLALGVPQSVRALARPRDIARRSISTSHVLPAWNIFRRRTHLTRCRIWMCSRAFRANCVPARRLSPRSHRI